MIRNVMKGNEMKSANSKCQEAIDRKRFIKMHYDVFALDCGAR